VTRDSLDQDAQSAMTLIGFCRRVTDPAKLLTKAEYDYRGPATQAGDRPQRNLYPLCLHAFGLLASTPSWAERREQGRHGPGASTCFEYDFLESRITSSPFGRTIRGAPHQRHRRGPDGAANQNVTVDVFDGVGATASDPHLAETSPSVIHLSEKPPGR